MSFEARPANVAEILTLHANGQPIARAVSRRLMMQALYSETVALVEDGQVKAVIGFFPWGTGQTELWFLIARDAGPRLINAMRRLARLTLATLSHSDSMVIFAHVAVGYRTGQRLARLIGLKQAGQNDRHERWEWTHERIDHGPAKHVLRRSSRRGTRRRRERRAGGGSEPAEGSSSDTGSGS
jgi:hypothetical protein